MRVWGQFIFVCSVKVNPAKVLFSRFCFYVFSIIRVVLMCAIWAVSRFWTGSSRSRLSPGEPQTSAFTKAANWRGFVRSCWMSDSVWVWICLRKRWKPKTEDNFVSSYVRFPVGDCASVRGVWAFLPPETLHTDAALTGSQISLFSSKDLFVLSGFPNCSKVTASAFSSSFLPA